MPDSSAVSTSGNEAARPKFIPFHTDIKAALRYLVEPGTVLEIRILEPTDGYGTWSGYFDDPEVAAKAAAVWSGKCAAVYLTLNPVRPELLARAAMTPCPPTPDRQRSRWQGRLLARFTGQKNAPPGRGFSNMFALEGRYQRPFQHFPQRT